MHVASTVRYWHRKCSYLNFRAHLIDWLELLLLLISIDLGCHHISLDWSSISVLIWCSCCWFSELICLSCCSELVLNWTSWTGLSTGHNWTAWTSWTVELEQTVYGFICAEWWLINWSVEQVLQTGLQLDYLDWSPTGRLGTYRLNSSSAGRTSEALLLNT